MSDSTSVETRVATYLADVERELINAGVMDRTEILEGIFEHIREELSKDGPCDVEELLRNIGSPHAIAASARGEESTSPGMSLKDWVGLVLLAVGGFVFAIGWCVGVAMLWSSSVWNRRQKLLGTLVIPGGFAAVWAWLVLSTTPSGCQIAKRGAQVIAGHCYSALVPLPLRLVIGALMIAAEAATIVYLTRSARGTNFRRR